MIQFHSYFSDRLVKNHQLVGNDCPHIRWLPGLPRLHCYPRSSGAAASCPADVSVPGFFGWIWNVAMILIDDYMGVSKNRGTSKSSILISSWKVSRWWFQLFFIFAPIWGRFPFWLICFKRVETTNQLYNVDYSPENKTRLVKNSGNQRAPSLWNGAPV